MREILGLAADLRIQHDHAAGRVLAQPCGDNASGRARANG
jgi:hypothetical protein